MILLRNAQARARRLAQLRKLRRPTRAQYAELHRLEASETQMWRTLPRRIASLRADLEKLTAFADEIGLGPC